MPSVSYIRKKVKAKSAKGKRMAQARWAYEHQRRAAIALETMQRWSNYEITVRNKATGEIHQFTYLPTLWGRITAIVENDPCANPLNSR